MVNEKALIVLPSRGTALDRDDRSVNQLNAICLYSLLIKKPLFIFLWSFSFLRITFFFCILQHLYAQYYENPTDCTKQETQWPHLNDQARNPQPDNGDSMSNVPHQTNNSSAMSLTGSCHIKWWLSLDTNWLANKSDFLSTFQFGVEEESSWRGTIQSPLNNSDLQSLIPPVRFH